VKTLAWLLLFAFGCFGIAIPAVYFWKASHVPKLDSEFDLQILMRTAVEGERMSLRMGQASRQAGGFNFERPDFSKIPRDLVALHISQLACPSYFQTPREEGLAWSWRMFAGALFRKGSKGDGRCERYFSLRIAEEIGIFRGLERDIAANKIHRFLQKDQLVAYALAGNVFDRAVVGLEAASRGLFKARPDELNLAQLAELSLALPPVDGWWDLAYCHNPAGLRQLRDGVLNMLADQALTTEDRAKTASNLPLTCTTTTY
jgi:hypothetical protein